METTLLLVVLLAALVLFVTQLARVEVTAIGIVVALTWLNLLTPAEALAGFSSPATVTVAAMLVLGAGLERTGAGDLVARRLARLAARGPRGILCALGLPAAALSAFVNNTAVVALMLPVALGLARRAGSAPSKLLLPLSYFAILGGTCTLFGTSTNLLVDQLAREAGAGGFRVFDFAPLGVVYLAIGGAFVLLVAPRLLPARESLAEMLAVRTPGRFVTEVVVAGGKLPGQTIERAFPPLEETRVLQLAREDGAQARPGPEVELQAGDVLLVECSARALAGLLALPGVERGSAVRDERRVALHGILSGEALEDPRAVLDDPSAPEVPPEGSGAREARVAEAVVTPRSRFVGRRLATLRLAREHGILVLGLRRFGRHHQSGLRGIELRAGDVLLVQGPASRLRLLAEEGDVLLVEGVEETLVLAGKAPLAVGILAGVVLLASLGVAPIVFLALSGVALLLATRCLTAREAVAACSPEVVLLLAATIPLGLAMERSGLAASVAAMLVEATASHRPWVLVAALYLLTSLLTELLSNNATAVLMTPIALTLAQRTGAAPEALLMAVAFGASASFATPIGYQTNTLVMGPGGYRFRDYLLLGLPMNVLMATAASVLIPHFWPVGPG